MFMEETATNKQNVKGYAHSYRDLLVNVRSHFRPRKPVCVMVCAVVVIDGGKYRLAFIDEGLKVNSQVYLNILLEKVFILLTETLETFTSSHKKVLQATQRT